MRTLFAILFAMLACYLAPIILITVSIPILLALLSSMAELLHYSIPHILPDHWITIMGNTSILLGYLLSLGLLYLTAHWYSGHTIRQALSLHSIKLSDVPLCGLYFFMTLCFLCLVYWQYMKQHHFNLVWDNYLIILLSGAILSEITIRGFLYKLFYDKYGKYIAIFASYLLSLIPALFFYWSSLQSINVEGPHMIDHRGLIAIIGINMILSYFRAQVGSVYPIILLRVITCLFYWIKI